MHRHSLIHALMVATVLAPNLSLGAVCARTTTALTSSCGGKCYEGRPCIAYASSANSSLCLVASTFSKCELGGDDNSCAYECFKNGQSDNVERGIVDFSSYTFLIPFGDSVSNWESNWTADERAAWEKNEGALANWTSTLPSKSNNLLQNIEPLKFLAATKRVYVGDICTAQKS